MGHDLKEGPSETMNRDIEILWLAARTIMVIVARPRLWPVAIRTIRVFWPDEWGPLPRYIRWRVETMYGNDMSGACSAHVIEWMTWADRFRADFMRTVEAE